jgi:predicted O-methyltransferase YrrM
MKKALANLAVRARLLRTALMRRYIFSDLALLTKDIERIYEDVRADVHPFEFMRMLNACAPALPSPDWSFLDADIDCFTPPEFPRRYNSEPSVARFLGELVIYRRAKTVIELGCFVGWTTAHLSLAIKVCGGEAVYAIDPSRAFLDSMQKNLKRHGLDDVVRPVEGFSCEEKVLAILPDQAEVIFIDAGHDYPQTLHEVEIYAKRLASNGFIVLHDSISAPGVRRSLLELKGFRKMTFSTERSNGVTVLFRLQEAGV